MLWMLCNGTLHHVRAIVVITVCVCVCTHVFAGASGAQ